MQLRPSLHLSTPQPPPGTLASPASFAPPEQSSAPPRSSSPATAPPESQERPRGHHPRSPPVHRRIRTRTPPWVCSVSSEIARRRWISDPSNSRGTSTGTPQDHLWGSDARRAALAPDRASSFAYRRRTLLPTTLHGCISPFRPSVSITTPRSSFYASSLGT